MDDSGVGRFQHPAIGFLTEIIKDLREGRVTTVCCICIGPNGESKMPTAGMQVPELNLACEIVKARIIQDVMKPSPIVRAI
jgi:hypothetical protein